MKIAKLNRVGALIIDLIFISLAYTLIFNFIPEEWLTTTQQYGWVLQTGTLLYYGTFLVYFLLFDFTNSGDSPGKELLKLQTRDMSGQKLERKRSIKRTLLKLVSMIICPVSALLYLFGEGEFSLHDAYFNTSVFPQGKPVKNHLFN
ncbi:RDD family protein [Robiginitalea sp. IMCC43444]|uniref:RDD family protein n=1 Tax=Robiginitalea sp. IMCC43444 TaxID=3459121 RepID=UPI004041F240